MNSADLRTEMGPIVSKIVDLLRDEDEDVRQASINTLFKFVEHGKTSLFQFLLC